MKTLISLRDPVLTDVVKTAFKQFPGLTSYPVPHQRLAELVATGDYDAVVVDLDSDRDSATALLREVRGLSSTVALLVVVEDRLKDRLNRLKVELDVFSLIATPLDPFDLARKIVRLEHSLSGR